MNLSKPNLSKLAQGILIFLFISVINVLKVIKFPMREIITYVHLPPTLHLLEGGGGGARPAAATIHRIGNQSDENWKLSETTGTKFFEHFQ